MHCYGMLNFDRVGVSSEQVPGSLDDNRALSDLLIAAATRQGYPIGHDVSPGSSDHISFGAIGIPVAFLYTAGTPMLCGPDYHRSTDTPEKVDDRQVERVIAITYATILDLAVVARPIEPAQIFLSSFSVHPLEHYVLLHDLRESFAMIQLPASTARQTTTPLTRGA